MSPKAVIRPFDMDNPDRDVLSEAANALRQGKLVVFPTETVYGLACDGQNQDAVERLYTVKKRPRDKPIARLLPDDSALMELVPQGAGRRLADFLWPGPLTLVFDVDGQSLGYRVPEPFALRDLILTSGCEVIATSANLAGQEPATSAEAAAAQLGDVVDLILDGGEAKFGESSTVVRVAPAARPEILREGLIAKRVIQEVAARSFVFVCTGNTCRSPMSEIFMKQALADALGIETDQLLEHGYWISSAGLAATPGHPATSNSQIAAMEFGFDLSQHRSQTLASSLLVLSEALFGLSLSHVEVLQQNCPDLAHKIKLLDPGGESISDPYGGDLDEYRACARQIHACVKQRVQEIMAL